MNRTKIFAAVAAALVAGVVMGSVSSGFAATAAAPAAAATAACAGAGMRLGATMRDSGGRMLDVVAKLTGQTTAQVVTERQAGKTFTQIAAEKNVSANAVVDEALKVRQAALADKVKSGTITQTQADAALSTMKTRLTDRVDDVNTSCNGAGGGGMGRGAGTGGGMGGGRGAGAGAGANQ